MTIVLLSLPYVAGVLVWAKCLSFARRHSVDLQSIANRGSKHRLVFPAICLATLVTTIVLAVAAQNKDAGIGLFLLLLSASLALNLYLAYAVVFHGAWVVAAVFGSTAGADPVARLQTAFRKHQQHKRFLGLCFAAVATLFAVSFALIAATIGRATIGLP